MQKQSKQQGASLIQVLVGIAIGAFILVIAGEMYYTVRHSYTRTVATLVNNTQASVVSQALRNLVDQATSPSPYGLWPWQQVDLRTPSSTFNPLNYPSIYAATTLSFYTPPNQVIGTDILMLQGVVASELTSILISTESGPTNIPTTLNIGANDFVLLANKSGYQVMKATAAASGGFVPVEQGVARSYNVGSFLAQYHVYILYLRELSGVRSLMLNLDNSGASSELIEDITDFQIRYFENGAWNDVGADGNPIYLNSWYKAIKGIEVRYTMDNIQYTMLIALKPNLL